MIARLRRVRTRGDRGAVLVEFALVTPLLVLIAMGIAEFGLAWRDSMTVAQALRSSARVVSNEGSERLADHQGLQALDSAIADIPDAAILRVVIFNAGTDSEPTAACKSGTSSSTSGRQCNVYSAADLDRPETDFTGTSSCSGSSPDRFWCPLTRDDDQGGTLDTIGVWIRVRHDYVTGVFPGGGITIEDTTIMRVEPAL